MQIPNVDPNDRSDDPVWFLLAQFSLSEFVLDQDKGDELAAGLLSQAVRSLGMLPEWVENVETTLAGFAREALAHFKPGELEIQGQIRVFCQKKVIDATNTMWARSRLYHSEQAVENIKMVLDPGSKLKGGWGYFLIERGTGSSSTGSTISLWNSVDLYLYKEGE